MVLVDAGPIIALCNVGDPDHRLCVDTLKTLAKPLTTTWTAFGEAMYAIGVIGERAHGGQGRWRAQKALWGLIDSGAIEAAEPTVHMLRRMRALMEQYHDTPMDLADASLVALAEERKIYRIFTLDGDFEVYRLPGKKPFVLLPGL